MEGDIPEAFAYLQRGSGEPGAIRWAAPEHFLVGDIQRTTKSDIYSLGNLIFLASPSLMPRISTLIFFQAMSGKFPWSEVHQDNAVMLWLSQGYKPARPESRPIQDVHWALIEQCWSPINQRPPAEDVVSLLQDFLLLYPTSQPLCDFLKDIRLLREASLSLVSMTSGSLLGSEDVVVDEVSALIHTNPKVFRRN